MTKSNSKTDIELIEEMRALLIEYSETFPAFRAKPQGSPNSPARKEQLADIRREDRVRAVLALRPGFAPQYTCGECGIPIKTGCYCKVCSSQQRSGDTTWQHYRVSNRLLIRLPSRKPHG